MADGKVQTIRFKQAIIAAGSEAVKLPFLPKDDPRVVTSTGALELRQRPRRMLVIGGGIIGLEMGTVYSTLGRAAGRGRDARRPDARCRPRPRQGLAEDECARFDKIMLKTKTVGAEATEDGIRVKFEGLDGSTSEGALRPGAAGRGPRAERQEDRGREGRRRRRRARLHRGRRPDADQRGAHLRDRRHRRPADARAQGGARGACGGRGGGRRSLGDASLAGRSSTPA